MLVSIKVFKYGFPFPSFSIRQPSGVACRAKSARLGMGRDGDRKWWDLVGGSQKIEQWVWKKTQMSMSEN
jgi:hypothetical protein